MPDAATFVFYALATLTLGGALGVAFSKNILRAAFLLLAALGGTAGLYLYMGADFVGVSQLLIYVGGILVLILFAVLLTQGLGEVAVTNRALPRGTVLPVAGLVALLLVVVALTTPWPRTEAIASPTTARLGDAFLRESLLPFELASVVLLMALVAAMVIARRSVGGARSARTTTTEGPGR